MLSVTFQKKIIRLLLTFRAPLYGQPASWSEMCLVKARQPGLLVGAMIWLGLRWLQPCWLQCTALSERLRGEGEGVIESWIVSLSSCQEKRRIVLAGCAWVAEQSFEMNQLISKSTSEDINTNPSAVISTQESDTALSSEWPLWIGSRLKEREQCIWTSPISQTTLSQINTFNGKCLVLALCSRAVDFAAQQQLSRGV